MQDIIDFFF